MMLTAYSLLTAYLPAHAEPRKADLRLGSKDASASEHSLDVDKAINGAVQLLKNGEDERAKVTLRNLIEPLIEKYGNKSPEVMLYKELLMTLHYRFLEYQE